MSDIQVTVVVDEQFASIQSGTLPASGGGEGDVTGPAGATDNAIARFDGTTGKLIQSSAATLDDAGNLTTPGTVNGRDLEADGLKLDGIAAGADVTADAGAVMASVVEAAGDLLVGTGAGAVGRLAHPGEAGKVPQTTSTGFEFVDPPGGGPDLSDATPQPVGSASAGVSSDASRADHVHAHGNQAGGTLHAEATTSTAGFMSAADKVKLDGLVAYDPLNDPDLLTLAG